MSNKRVNPFKLKLHLLECEADEKDKKIADLEAKLAESEERYKKAYQEGLLQKQFDKDMEIDQLKQQLAVSERNNSRLNSKLLQFYTRLGTNIHEQALGEFSKLKQQLAEKETRIAELEDKDWYEACIKQLEDQNGRLIEERDNYKLQLAEKDEQIDRLETLTFYADNIIQAYADKCKKHNQDKISFTVAELEKVREYIEKSTFYNVKLAIDIFYDYEFYKLLDNQINKIKKEKN